MIPILYVVSANSSKSAISHVKYALAAGCKWIQLQIDRIPDSKIEKAAKEIKKLCRENDATFIIENAINLVKSIEADGVHLTNGMTTAEAREILGEGFLIGINAKSSEEVISNKKQSADYICCGPYKISNDCPDEGLSLDDFDKIVSEVEEKGIFLPLSAYGNIRPQDIAPIMETGIRGFMIQINEENAKEQFIKDNLETYLKA